LERTVGAKILREALEALSKKGREWYFFGNSILRDSFSREFAFVCSHRGHSGADGLPCGALFSESVGSGRLGRSVARRESDALWRDRRRNEASIRVETLLILIAVNAVVAGTINKIRG
jgi:hypothetical protein